MRTPLEFVSHAHWSIGSELYKAYLQGDPRLEIFFEHPPDASLDWERAIQMIPIASAQRQSLYDTLNHWNHIIGNLHPQVQENIELLKDPRTFCVVSGQQTGVFLGPLYTIYKALTAVALSYYLNRQLPHYRFVPVFWCSADDHDYAEIAQTAFINPENELIFQRYQTDDPHLIPAYKMPTPENLPILIAELIAQFSDRPYAAAMQKMLTNSLTEVNSVGNWFGWLMGQLLGRFGVILTASNLPPLRHQMAPIFQKEIAQPGLSSRLVSDAGLTLQEMGFHVQLERNEHALNMFYHENRRRYRIMEKGNKFELDQLGAVWTAEHLQTMVTEHPERFSPGVVLRPIAQDMLFPTVCYIAGPGEIAYFAQLRAVYEWVNAPMPVIMPRVSLTILEPKIQRLLARLNLSAEEIGREPEEIVKRVMKATFPVDFEQKFNLARQSVNDALNELRRDINKLHDGVTQFADTSFGKIDYTLNQVAEKVYQAHKKENKTIRRQIDAVMTHILPTNHLQERVVNIFPYLINYGEDVLDDLLDFITAETTRRLETIYAHPTSSDPEN